MVFGVRGSGFDLEGLTQRATGTQRFGSGAIATQPQWDGGPERLLWGFAGQTTCILAANVERKSQMSRRLVFF